MGSALTRLYTCSRKRDYRVLMQGLDAAGKTTILYRLKLGKVTYTIPTMGFNVETVEHRNLSLTAWDVGGRSGLRALHRHYYTNTDALIFVVDSSDRERIDEVEADMSRALDEDELRGIPVLVFANKQDLNGRMTADDVTKSLKMEQIKCRRWHTQACCATNGDGLYEGLDWLCDAITNPSKIEQSVTSSTPDMSPYTQAVDGFSWPRIWQKLKTMAWR